MTDPYINRFPAGERQFVSNFLQELDYGHFIDNFSKKDQLYDNDRGFRCWRALIKIFLSTEIIPSSNTVCYNFKTVQDLPRDMLAEVIECLGWTLGVNPHTGGFSFWELHLKSSPQDTIVTVEKKLN